MATINFKKFPTAKYIKTRTLSFSNNEIALVKNGDILEIGVQAGSAIVNFTLTGKQFHSRLIDVKSTKFKVLKY